MRSRRAFLGASASSTLVAISGCVDAIPLVGSSSSTSGPSGAAESTESFLADPSLEPTVDAVPTADWLGSTVEAYDGSISDHASELSTDDDLSDYGIQVLNPGAAEAEAIASIDLATSAKYRANWQADDTEAEQPRVGSAEGGIEHLRGDYDREAYESAKELPDEPDGSAHGYDLYTEHGEIGIGLADDAILVAGLAGLHVPGEDVGEADRDVGTRALLERGASRSTSTESPPEWVQTVVDAVSPAHNLATSRRDTSDTEDGENDRVRARSLHVDGTETTVALAEGAPDASRFDRDDWTDGPVEEALLTEMARLTDRPRRDLDGLRERLVEAPTVELGDRHGVVSAVMPSTEVTLPDLS